MPGGILIAIGGLWLLAHVQSTPAFWSTCGIAVNQAIRQLGSVFGVALVVVLVGKPASYDLIRSFERFFVVLALGGLLTSISALGIDTRLRA